MSLVATTWALYKAPKSLDVVEFRILMVIADNCDDQGKGFAKSNSSMSELTGVSVRTIQNKIKSLLAKDIIRPGDQRLVAYIPANRRPKVYNLNMRSNRSSRGENAAPLEDVATPDSQQNQGCNRGAVGVQQGCNRGERLRADKTIETIETIETSESHAREKSVLQPIGEWVPDGALRALAKSLNLDVNTEFEKFHDRCLSEARTSADWPAAFRGWLRRGRELGLDKLTQLKPTPIPEHHMPEPHRHTAGCEHVRDLIEPFEWTLSSENIDGFGSSPLLKAKQALADRLNDGLKPQAALTDIGLSRMDELEDVA